MGLAAALLMLGGCAGTDRRDDWLSPDKRLHFVVSGGIAAATARYQLDQGVAPARARQRAVMLTLSVGTGKELYDWRVGGRFFSWRDMSWNLLGAACGAYLIAALD